ncbi:MAG: hypothetical protein WCA04_14725 [Geobacteraceae bacterium]
MPAESKGASQANVAEDTLADGLEGVPLSPAVLLLPVVLLLPPEPPEPQAVKDKSKNIDRIRVE